MKAATEAFLSSNVPRNIPREVRKAARRCSASFSRWPGILFLTMGLVFVWLFFPTRLVDRWKFHRGPTQLTEGTILSSKYSHQKMFGRRNSNPAIMYEYTYSYAPNAGGNILTGSIFAKKSKWKTGDVVPIRYLVAESGLAIPEGEQIGENDIAAVWMVLFPIVGLGMLVTALRTERREFQILKHGSVGAANVSAVEETGFIKNGRRIFELRLKRSDNGQIIIKQTGNAQEISLARKKKNSERPAVIVFDPVNPDQFLLPEAWGRPATDLDTSAAE